jgi:hypothetical protein
VTPDVISLTGERGEPRLRPDRRTLHGRLLLEGHMQTAAERAARGVVEAYMLRLEQRIARLEADLTADVGTLRGRVAELELVNRDALDERRERAEAESEAVLDEESAA